MDLHRLPLGDQRYTTAGPQRGAVWVCRAPVGGGGAFTQGPWINAGAGSWDATEKVQVDGDVRWDSLFTHTRRGSSLVLSGNGLPPRSGTFPIAPTDDAYSYDRNPNSIRPYTLQVDLPYNPSKAASRSCVSGAVGVAVDGVPFFNGFDAGGRDAVATEVQDRCNGHPQMTGQYHYHGLSSCLDWGSRKTKSELVGWAFDGFGIFVERDSKGRMLSSADLDSCHGRTSKVRWHGRERRIYHYVATLDFPYTVACYRGAPVRTATGIGIG